MGPLGHGFAVRPRSQNLLLVAGGMGIAPLVWLAEESVAKGKNVTFVLGVRTASRLLPPCACCRREVELIVATEDGSAGRKGMASQSFEELSALGRPGVCLRAPADVRVDGGGGATAAEPNAGAGAAGDAYGLWDGFVLRLQRRDAARRASGLPGRPRFELRDVF